MDFIERFFGISLDGGSGLFEVFLILALLLAVAISCRPGMWRAEARRTS